MVEDGPLNALNDLASPLTPVLGIQTDRRCQGPGHRKEDGYAMPIDPVFILAAHFWHIRDFSFIGNSKSPADGMSVVRWFLFMFFNSSCRRLRDS